MKRERTIKKEFLVLFAGLLLTMLFFMAKPAMAYESFIQGSDKQITKGFSYQCYTSEFADRKFSIDKKYQSIASVTAKGLLTAKKTGSFVLKETVSYGGEPVNNTYTIKVVKNEYTGPKYGSLKAKKYGYGEVHLVLLNAKLKGNKVAMKFAALNSRIFRAVKFNKLTLKVVCNGKTLAKKTFKNKAINLKKYGKKKMSFSVPISKNNKKLMDFGSKTFNVLYSYKYSYSFH